MRKCWYAVSHLPALVHGVNAGRLELLQPRARLVGRPQDDLGLGLAHDVGPDPLGGVDRLPRLLRTVVDGEGEEVVHKHHRLRAGKEKGQILSQNKWMIEVGTMRHINSRSVASFPTFLLLKARLRGGIFHGIYHHVYTMVPNRSGGFWEGLPFTS
jgi:hypothetical protein